MLEGNASWICGRNSMGRILKKSLAGEAGGRKKSLDDFTEGINQKIEIGMIDQMFMLS